MKSSPAIRIILLIAVAAIAVSAIATSMQSGWSVFSAAALLCAVALAVVLIVQTLRSRKPNG